VEVKKLEEKREEASGGRGPEAPGPPDWKKFLKGVGAGSGNPVGWDRETGRGL